MTAPTPPEGRDNVSNSSFMRELDSLAYRLQEFSVRVSGGEGMQGVTSGAQELQRGLAALMAEVQSGTKTQSEGRQRLLELTRGFDSARIATKEIEKNFKILEGELKKLNIAVSKTLGDRIFDKLGSVFGLESGAAIKSVFSQFVKVFNMANQMAANGIEQAGKLSITAQEGVALEFKNQATSLKSAFSNFSDPNKIISKDQLEATQQGLVTTLGGLGKGLELDPTKLEKTVGQFRDGLNSQITPTAETFRSLAQMGIEPTTAGLTQLREASGRAGLGLAQMNTLAKNAMAVQIFGQGITKATLDLDRMGISIQGIIRQSEAYVMNLDGAIDSISQLNQLGVQLDFGELTRLQEFDPAKAIQYVADKISPEQLQSTSFRALLSSVPGINIEEVLKLKGMEGLDKLEKDTTKQAEGAGKLDKTMASLSLMTKAVSGSFIGLLLALAGAITSLVIFGLQLRSINSMAASLKTIAAGGGTPGAPLPGAKGVPGASMVAGPTTGAPAAGTPPVPGAKAGAVSGAGMGVGMGAMSGINAAMAGGSWKKVIVATVAPILGSILGGALGGAMVTALAATGVGAPIAAAIGPSLISGMSILGGVMAGAAVNKFMDDGTFQSGYGERVIYTPGTGEEIKVNNSDQIAVGTNILPKGSLDLGATTSTSTAAQDNKAVERLIGKIDRFIEALNTAETTLIVNNTTQQKVKRASLVKVQTRDEE